jgi:hypothetical protein
MIRGRHDAHRTHSLRVTFAWRMRQIHAGCASHPRIRHRCCAHLPREECASRDVNFGPLCRSYIGPISYIKNYKQDLFTDGSTINSNGFINRTLVLPPGYQYGTGGIPPYGLSDRNKDRNCQGWVFNEQFHFFILALHLYWLDLTYWRRLVTYPCLKNRTETEVYHMSVHQLHV